MNDTWVKAFIRFECFVWFINVSWDLNVIFNFILDICLFIIYSIIYVICQKKLSNSSHSAMHYPAIAFLGSAATRHNPQLTTMKMLTSVLRHLLRKQI